MTGHNTSTKTAYAATWSLFRRWAGSAGHSANPPIAIATVVAYVASWPPGLGRSGRKLRLAGLAYGHLMAGAPWQPRNPAIAALLRGANADEAALTQRLACCANDLTGLRDRTLLLLHHRAGLNRIQLAALDHADLDWRDDALVIQLRDAHDPPCCLPVARRRGDPACPVAVLDFWLQIARIRYGAVIQRLGAHGWPDGGLDRRGVRLALQAIEQRAAALAGTLPPGRAPVAGAWRTAAHRKAQRDARNTAEARRR